MKDSSNRNQHLQLSKKRADLFYVHMDHVHGKKSTQLQESFIMTSDSKPNKQMLLEELLNRNRRSRFPKPGNLE